MIMLNNIGEIVVWLAEIIDSAFIIKRYALSIIWLWIKPTVCHFPVFYVYICLNGAVVKYESDNLKGGDMNIRIANEMHVSGIVSLWKDYIDFHAQLDPFFTRKKDGEKRYMKYIMEQIHLSKSLVLVGLVNDQVVAYSLSQIKMYPPVFQKYTYGYISDMAVRAEYQKKGLGDMMLECIVKWFKSKNIHRIELQVFSHNMVGNSFWRKHGFKNFKYVMKIEFLDDTALES
jgi:ribosomal protein S18 acetylase RimI-like enzyme